ncbi:hypothetical protein GGI22_003702 [Coemansia erecta]|nr:hypothetical protein GGI22_003702 [Coemansia erecta]
MLMFSTSSSSMSSAGSSSGTMSTELGSSDDVQPNSLYGGSSAAIYAENEDPLRSELPPAMPVDHEDYTAHTNDPIVAKCVVERASSRRRENYYFMMGKKVGWCV